MKCAERVARVNLEMGGKDAFIVCADVADELEVAAQGGAWAAFLNAGQVCTSAERFYVHRRRLRRVPPGLRRPHARRSSSATRWTRPPTSGRWSPPSSAARSPPRSRRRWTPAPSSSSAAATPGASAATSSPPPSSPAPRPTPRSCARRPSAPSRRSSRSARSTRRSSSPTRPAYGLGANVYTRDLANTVRCLREIKAGTVWFNDPLTDNDAGPFGGFKQSGPRPRARPRGPRGLPGDQARPHRDRDRAKDWWYPYAEGGEGPAGGRRRLSGSNPRGVRGGRTVAGGRTAPLRTGRLREPPGSSLRA